MATTRARTRTLLPILFIAALAACSEPRDPFDAITELQSHNTKIERDIFTLTRERLETIEATCFRLYGVGGGKPDPGKLADCFTRIVEAAFKADANASEFTLEALKWTQRILDNFREEWLTSTNEQRAALKKKIIEAVTEALKKLAELPLTDKKPSITTRILKSATNELIREDLIAPGTTADVIATGRLLDPVGPGLIRIEFPADAPNRVLVDDPILGTQAMLLDGQVTLVARIDATAPNVLQLEVSSLDLFGSNLDFDAVSTGINRIGPSVGEPSRGNVDLTTGQVVLGLALAVTNDFLPEGVLIMNVPVAGQIRAAGADTLVKLGASGPAVSAFPSNAPPPPTDLTAMVDAGGATLALGEGTAVVIPPGALSSPTDIGLFMTAAVLSPIAVPAGLDRVAVTREVLPIDQIFNTGVTVSIPYNLGDIAGLDESTLRALVFDETTRTWRLIPDSAVDILEDVVTFQLSNFETGYFGLGGRNISGDLDADGDVDRDDAAIILNALNTPASGPDDSRDLNKDGRIDLLDARLLATLCTRPACAIP